MDILDITPSRPDAEPQLETVSERPRRVPWYAAAAPALLLVLVASVVRLPYFVISPGPARDVAPLIHIEGHQTYPSNGHLLLTAVYQTVYEANAYDLIGAWLDPARAVIPKSALYAPGETQRQEEQVQQSLMDQSKIDAAVVALSAYGGYPKSHGPGALVEQVFAQTPAEGKLFAGDVILSVDGKKVGSPTEIGVRIRAAGVGTPLHMVVRPLGEEKTRDVTVTPAKVPQVDRPIIGVSMVANFPFGVSIDSGAIGGPSAGLMWTLGLVEELTPGDLTGGRTIAGTGTIGTDGRVGPIGGVEQKVRAAENAGAVIFFTPVENAVGARSVARTITVVPVSTYREALSYLSTHR